MTNRQSTRPLETEDSNDRNVFPAETEEANGNASSSSETEEAIERNTFSTKTEETRKRTVSDKVLWVRFYQYLKPYRKNLIFGFISIIGGALTGLVAPYLHALAINDIISPAAKTGDTSYLNRVLLVDSLLYLNYWQQLHPAVHSDISNENHVGTCS